MDFYADKSPDLPRLAYRRAVRGVADMPSTGEIRSPIATLCAELRTLKGDYLKLKFYLPDFLDRELNPKERQLVRETLATLRGKVRNRLTFVYPHSADEFSLSTPFLMEMLGESPAGEIKKHSKCFTLGSCFARNIGTYLKDKGFDVEVLPQTEDLNSPFSNAELLTLCAAEPGHREQVVAAWLKFLSPETAQHHAEDIQNISRGMEAYKNAIAAADVVILTLGNNLDFFGPPPPAIRGLGVDPSRGYEVAPKFLGFVSSEDVDTRLNFAKILTSRGFGLRAGTFTETKDAVTSMLRAIRQINASCKIFVTVSPVPIDSAVGLADSDAQSAIQLDCQSKSQLRCIVEEVTREAAVPFTYFPSFEVVRWVAPMVIAPIFGTEDASSRHVSGDILQAIFDLFFECHCDDAEVDTDVADSGERRAS